MVFNEPAATFSNSRTEKYGVSICEIFRDCTLRIFNRKTWDCLLKLTIHFTLVILISIMACKDMHSENNYPQIDSNGLAHKVEKGKIYQTTVRFINNTWTTFFEAHISTKALIFKWENIEDFPELKNARDHDTRIFIFQATAVQEVKNSYDEVIQCRIIQIK